MEARWFAGWMWVVLCVVSGLVLGGCDSSTPSKESGHDAGGVVDSGTASSQDDAGTPDGGALPEPLPCERTLGVCAGARRALVDGAYEPTCTALSYGSAYEEVEARCDGLDNDCDGVTDPPVHWGTVTTLREPLHAGMVSSVRVADGVLVAAFDRPGVARVLWLDTALALRAIRDVPVDTEGGPLTTVSSRLLRTAQGPALYYASTGLDPNHTRGHLIVLDETGVPLPQQEGGTAGALLFDHPVGLVSSGAGTSPDGARVLVVWNNDSALGAGPTEVLGAVVDLEGQVLAGPLPLFRVRSENSTLRRASVLGLRDGGFLVSVFEAPPTGPGHVRLGRFDGALAPVGDERALATGDEPLPSLVDLGAGSPAESPALLLRELSAGTRELRLARDLLGGGLPEPLVTATPGEVPWFGAMPTARGLQVAWLSVASVPRGGDSWFDYQGRFWSVGQEGAARDWTPGVYPMPLHRFAQWVLLEELPERWMGALVMTSTETPREHALQSVRYCAP